MTALSDRPIPGLRGDIEVSPMTYQGQEGVMVRDTLGLFPDPVFIQGMGTTVLSLIDGKRTPRDIQLILVRMQQGVFFSLETVEEIIFELDGALLLDSENYRQKRDRLIRDYKAEGTREAKLAGSAYPDTAKELSLFLDQILKEKEEDKWDLPPSSVRALVAPHIDIAVGRPVYSQAYNSVRDLKPSRILLLGIGHHLQDAFFSLTQKDFVSPLGKSPADREWIERLRGMGPDVVAPDDIIHRSEHSIEFQLIFLQFLFGTGVPLIPILCGSFHEILFGYNSPREVPGMGGFLDGLKRLREEEPELLIVAGVDFAHIGPKFGHSKNASLLLQETRVMDQNLLEHLCRSDLQGFWNLYRQSGGKSNVCGLSALSVLMDLVPDLSGHMLGYDIWREEPTQSAVSFAAVAFTSPIPTPENEPGASKN